MSSKTGLLSMCRRAGKLLMGMDIVKDSCRSGEARAVFVTTDLSEKSLKEVRFFCGKNGVKLYRLDASMDDIGMGVGKRSGILSITDAGFAKACAKGLEQIDTNEI